MVDVKIYVIQIVDVKIYRILLCSNGVQLVKNIDVLK